MRIELWDDSDLCFKFVEVQKDDDSIAKLIEEYGFINDHESAHINADDIIVALLDELGYRQTVKAWQDVPKWYS